MSALPNHIAIIPDGNRRWAKARLFNPWDGHTEGVKRFWEIAEFANLQGVKFLTFWAASYGNLTKRSALEVKFLVELLALELGKPELKSKLITNGIRLRVIGEWDEIIKDKKLKTIIFDLESTTKDFTNSNLTILFGYDGQREMLSAINDLVTEGKKVNEDDVNKALWTWELPDVDFAIRTGGEPHWSAGFMMWQTANSQLYFTETLWPDFKIQEFQLSIEIFNQRERRHGK